MKSVLIVDDQEEIREILAFGFKEAGINVFEAGSADEALKICQSQEIHCLISDYLMPKKNGADLVRALRDLEIQIPVFMMTGYLECPRQELIDLKVQATVFKPFEPDELILQVKKVIG
ncbi:MAG: response regulator [Bacteriovoracaceae bacterium]|jgi:CheY-like chemotaxis protein|nr:response regulator [Bacteriovoracaceae bacterium]